MNINQIIQEEINNLLKDIKVTENSETQYDRIISESIHNFLINEGFFEAKTQSDRAKKAVHRGIKKYNKMQSNNKFKDQAEQEKKRDGNAMNSEDESEIRNMVNNSDLINVAALARKVFPDHTPEGAQSQLRKQLKGIKNDSGKQYHIKQRVGQEIRKQMQKL